MFLTYLSTNILEHILIYLPIFDVHNLWQLNSSSHKLKKITKEQYAKYHGFNKYQELKKFYKSLDVFKVIDVLDTRNIWCEAYVIGHQVHNGVVNIKVKYLGYSDCWNEWLRADTGRITHNGAKCYTGKNELKCGHQVIYYYRNKWIVCQFLEFYNMSLVPMMRFVYKGKERTGIYLKSYLAPVSRRNIIM